MLAVDNAGGGIARLDLCVYVTADIQLSTTNWADITGLTSPLTAGKKYAFLAYIFHSSAATTTGAWFGVNMPAAPTTLMFGVHSGVTNSVTAGVQSIGTATARDTAATGQTTGSTGVTVTNLSGFIIPSATGTFAIRARPEVAAAITIKLGSWLRIREVEN